MLSIETGQDRQATMKQQWKQIATIICAAFNVNFIILTQITLFHAKSYLSVKERVECNVNGSPSYWWAFKLFRHDSLIFFRFGHCPGFNSLLRNIPRAFNRYTTCFRVFSACLCAIAVKQYIAILWSFNLLIYTLFINMLNFPCLF